MRPIGKRLIAAAADVLLLTAGMIAAIICAAAGAFPGEAYNHSIDVVCIITLCFFATIIVVEIVSALRISDSTVHTILVAAALFGYFLSSFDFIDLLRGFNVPAENPLAQCFHFAFFCLCTLSVFYFWNYTYRLGVGKGAGVGILSGAAVCVGLYIGLTFAGAEAIAFGIYAAGLAALWLYAALSIARRKRADSSYYITEMLFFAICGCGIADTLCGTVFIPLQRAGISSYYAIAIIALFVSIYISYAIRTDRNALKASEYKLQYERMKAEALRGQIKPHFIFNSLAAIQSLYHRSMEEGDRATALFSKHLRANVEAANVDLIPFEQELENIQVYIDLENLRSDPPFCVIFDIEETDFSIPVLSLQPYLENAVRYSKVNQSEDGAIRISSHRTGHGILLEISDNGVGFCVDSISPSSCGIRNSRERFRMLMGIEPAIVSEIGKGTTVSILIPCGGKEQS